MKKYQTKIINQLNSNESLPEFIYEKYNPKNKLTKKIPKISDITIQIPIQIKKNTWVFYWAAEPQNKSNKINEHNKAYEKNKNHGLQKSDSQGKVELILNCPQPYKLDDITYPRHIHYTILNNDKSWNESIETILVKCSVEKSELIDILKQKTHLVINSLSEENYMKDHIPETFNLPVHSINPRNRNKKIKSFVKEKTKELSKLNELIKENKLDFLDIPIIIYCAHSECNSSEKLYDEFIKITEKFLKN